MKIIHAADIHLGSKIDKSITKNISEDLKMAIRSSFNNMIEYANRNNINVILLSGDVFDSDTPTAKDKKFFFDSVRNNPNISFYYLKGNHDQTDQTLEDIPTNLFTFDKTWSKFEIDNVNIAGIEISDENKESLYSTLSLENDKFNIVMLHGYIKGNFKSKDFIDLNRLTNKNINYLALGHIHKREQGTKLNLTYAYPGCLQGRSFDEAGKHGFYVLDIADNNTFSTQFIPINSRELRLEKLDVSDCENDYQVSNLIKKSYPLDLTNLYRIELYGEISEDVNLNLKEIENSLSTYFFFVNIADHTRLAIDVSLYKNDPSIKGEFVRLVESDQTLTDEEKRDIVKIGLSSIYREKL